MSRSLRIWLAVGLAACAVLGVMISITATLLQTERAAAEATAHAVAEERVRLALWRLDSAIPGRISQEMARVALLAEQGQPSADLPTTPDVRARFIRTADGSLRWLTPPPSPQLDRVVAALTSDALVLQMRPDVDLPAQEHSDDAAPPDENLYGASPRSRSSREWAKRASSVRDNLSSIDTVQQQQSAALLENLTNKVTKLGGPSVGSDYAEINRVLEDEQASLASARLGPVEPLWVDDELLLLRRVRRGEDVEVHGAWMDWPVLRTSLLDQIRDLLPEPSLSPVPDPSSQDAARMLATLPVRLEHAPLPLPPAEAFSPVRTSIIVGWVVVLLASGLVVALLRWSMALSERRAAFVSTVTHELRTPLTTFRMYTEMLGEKMVEAKRDRYIATLRSEAERLGQLVENVLAYARIENDRAERARERLSVQTLVERLLPRLRERCEASGSELEVTLAPQTGGRMLEVDPAAIEQILLNLVDNGAKYGASEDAPARMMLEVVTGDREVSIGLRDWGPGIPRGERRKIFEPFSKASRHEAGTKPGVGLGLALCRRLARAHGGDLTIEDAAPGARFVLSLPSPRR